MSTGSPAHPVLLVERSARLQVSCHGYAGCKVPPPPLVGVVAGRSGQKGRNALNRLGYKPRLFRKIRKVPPIDSRTRLNETCVFASPEGLCGALFKCLLRLELHCIVFKSAHSPLKLQVVSSSNCSIRGAAYSHCITFTSFPRGIHRPLVGAFARKLRASSFPGSAGIQSSGLSSCSCNRNGHYRVQKHRFP
ncbi:hypothetical protein EYF80_004036 [Liparis tanakae]|uniref:Uncharacterized protein n=1 Tax=Liparis tanakae TaxID=230148 RepID=A0A4Z2J6H2_9TELE|nr:hypothetical protein EYF80_004036 [Liparis tanakae]